MKLHLLLLTSLLVACSPTATIRGIPLASESDRLEHFSQKCQDYGFEANSTELAECIKQHDLQWERTRRNEPEMSLLCKDAIARSNWVAIQTHC